MLTGAITGTGEKPLRRAVITASWRHLLPGLLLLLAGGCTFLPLRTGDAGLEGQQSHLEKLVAGQYYQQALQYLPELSAGMEAAVYETERSRLLALILELETATEAQATELRGQNQPGAALMVVEQALEKIPRSPTLQELSKNLRQELELREKTAAWQLLVSRATYLSSQLQVHQELARLRQPSWISRWRLKTMAESLRALHPELLDCGRQGLAAMEKEVSGQCLQLARDIEESTEVADLLVQVASLGPAQFSTPELEPGPEPADQAALVPITAVKKSRPGTSASSLLPELESRLQQEIFQGEINQGYATLARLEKLPGANEPWRNYKAQLDRAREIQVEKYLEAGAALYRGGMIAQARESWLRVLELEPENLTAREKINRAERVLKKLRDLQDAQRDMTPVQ